jgi:septum formation protein
MLFLASISPRRKQLFQFGGWGFCILPAEVDEHPLMGESPLDYVLRLAKDKAYAAASSLSSGVVVAADTTVSDRNEKGEKILGKPTDAADAERMLWSLRGHTHQVYTSVSILRIDDQVFLNDLCRTDVPMRNYTDEEIVAYIATGDPFDKAGAYAIQHTGFHPVEAMRGCFANVMGLPVCHLARNLIKLGIPPEADIPTACRTKLMYPCTISDKVLKWGNE